MLRINYDYIHYIGFPLLTIIVAFFLAKLIRFLMTRYLEKSSLTLKVDKTRYSFLKNAVTAIIYLIALIVIFFFIPQLRSLGVGLFAGAGIFAAIIGFASQAAFSNIVSGIFIVIFKPFRVGDNLKIGDLHHGFQFDAEI